MTDVITKVAFNETNKRVYADGIHAVHPPGILDGDSRHPGRLVCAAGGRRRRSARRRGAFRPERLERESIEPFALGVDESFLLASVEPQSFQHAESGEFAEPWGIVSEEFERSAQRIA